MAILVVEFSREGYKFRKVFGLKSNYLILIIRLLAGCLKLDIFNEKRNQKDLDEF